MFAFRSARVAKIRAEPADARLEVRTAAQKCDARGAERRAIQAESSRARELSGSGHDSFDRALIAQALAVDARAYRFLHPQRLHGHSMSPLEIGPLHPAKSEPWEF